MVSASGKQPHVKKTGQYVCDKGCGNWNSLTICSHTVAVAEINGELSKYISWFIKAKKKPSLTKLVTTGMPDGRGRKGGKVAQPKRMRAATCTSRTPISVVSGTGTQIADPSCSSTSLTVPDHPPPLLLRVHHRCQNHSYFVLSLAILSLTNLQMTCVRHKEWREFFPPGSRTAQTRFCNVYYHCNSPCIQARCPTFLPELPQIPALIAAQLLPVASSPGPTQLFNVAR